MSLQSRLASLITAIGADIKALQNAPIFISGGLKTSGFTAAVKTHYVITLASGLGAVTVQLPTAPPNETQISFTRTDSFSSTSFCNITAGGSDNVYGGTTVWILKEGSITLVYFAGTWWPLAVGYSGLNALNGPTNLNVISSLMSRDAAGRSQVVDPSVAQDISTKNYTDGIGTSAPTASTVMRRDAAGRVQNVDPSAAQDSATKNYVDVTAGTSASTANALMRRDAAGRVQHVDPSAAQDSATKNYADALGIATPSASSIMRRDSAGRAQVIDPSVSADIATKSYVDTIAPTPMVTGSTVIGATETVLQSIVIPANTFKVGTTFKFYAAGMINAATTSPTLLARIRAGTAGTTADALVCGTNAGAMNTNTGWQIEGVFTCRTIGATGTVIGNVRTIGEAVATGYRVSAQISTITLNTTIQQIISLTFLPGGTTPQFHIAQAFVEVVAR